MEVWQDTTRRLVGHGREEELTMRAEGGLLCPSFKMVRFFSSFFHYIILTSTILHLEPLKTSVHTCFQGLWASFDQHRISTTQNPWHQVFTLVLGGCRLSLAATPYQQSYKPRNWVFALVFRGCGLSLGQRHCHHFQQPPEPLKSSIHAWFWVLLPLQPPKSSANAQFRALWVCKQLNSKIEHVQARLCYLLYSCSPWCIR